VILGHVELLSLESRAGAVNPNRLLILDDDPEVLSFLGEVGRQCRYEVALTASDDEFRQTYTSFDPTTIVLDLKFGTADAIDVMTYLDEQSCQAPILLISGFDARVLETTRRIGLSRGLTVAGATEKPVSYDAVQDFLDRYREPEYDEWAQELQVALVHHQVEVVYQPKVRLADGAVVGVEALARWRHPVRGLIGPDRFIPVAEATGLIAQLTDVVLARAAADGAAWHAAGLPLCVAVNIAPQLLTRPAFLDEVMRTLDAVGFPPDALTLEIVESTAIRRSAGILELLSRLRLRGVTVSLDDFGSGFANFDILTQVPINELKIDRSVIAHGEESREHQVVMKAIADIAQQLGLTTVAEGVEDVATCRWLATLGIDQIQGYGIAAPMPADEILPWAQSWNQSPLT
jgi:EAL domain-containing protein (putative c-di-GMP-specific phosphodiesterase class I)